MHQSDSVSVLMYSFDGNCLEITRYLSVPGYIRGVLSQFVFCQRRASNVG